MLVLQLPWQRGKNWDEATAEDLLDFEDWRRWSPRNPQRIGGSKWNRELAALRRLYKWAVAKLYMAASPATEREVMGRHGQMISVPAVRAKDTRASNVKWPTPRAYRMWRDVGLRGYTHRRAPVADTLVVQGPGAAGTLDHKAAGEHADCPTTDARGFNPVKRTGVALRADNVVPGDGSPGNPNAPFREGHSRPTRPAWLLHGCRTFRSHRARSVRQVRDCLVPSGRHAGTQMSASARALIARPHGVPRPHALSPREGGR
ncbi:hypothetical protein AB0A98_22620 [Streptomyces chrestomyceticus]|uniref:hypothetical protein n=1 Tax=Streptomyces chrestomyceticus TaxID=68185 RepID=UPI0033DDB51B